MTNVFKKTGIAAAVAGALMAVSGGAQAQSYAQIAHNAMILATPDDVMLVPNVICDLTPTSDGYRTLNTLVGLNTIFPDRGAASPARRPSPKAGATVRNLHWRFYDEKSRHRIDGLIPVTDNDFVRFDWCTTIVQANKTKDGSVNDVTGGLNKLKGYLLFHADGLIFNTTNNLLVTNSAPIAGVSGTIPDSANYLNALATYEECAARGSDAQNRECTSAYWSGLNATIQGINNNAPISFDTRVLVKAKPAESASTALTFNRLVWLYGHSYLIKGNWGSQAFIPILTAPVWDTVVRDGFPSIRRLERGIDYTRIALPTAPDLRYRDVMMRYFLDSALATQNDMVFWFNYNDEFLRNNTPVETFDSEQTFMFSSGVDLSWELNVVRSTPDAPAFPGMQNGPMNDSSTVLNPVYGQVKNTGLIHFYVPELNHPVSWIASGVAFNLLSLGAGSSSTQVQTEMATGSYELAGPF